MNNSSVCTDLDLGKRWGRADQKRSPSDQEKRDEGFSYSNLNKIFVAIFCSHSLLLHLWTEAKAERRQLEKWTKALHVINFKSLARENTLHVAKTKRSYMATREKKQSSGYFKFRVNCIALSQEGFSLL